MQSLNISRYRNEKILFLPNHRTSNASYVLEFVFIFNIRAPSSDSNFQYFLSFTWSISYRCVVINKGEAAAIVLTLLCIIADLQQTYLCLVLLFSCHVNTIHNLPFLDFQQELWLISLVCQIKIVNIYFQCLFMYWLIVCLIGWLFEWLTDLLIFIYSFIFQQQPALAVTLAKSGIF